MLVPLTRKTFETLIPVLATGPQYVYYWGKLPDLLRRLLYSVAGIFVIILIEFVLQGAFALIVLTVGIVVGLYWLWGPILWASLRNLECRKYQYSGFWQGEVLDVYLTEELIGEEETVNKRGDLVIVENRERCLNLEVGDGSGFSTSIQVPLKRNYQAIAIGDAAQMLVLSNRADLGRIGRTTDIFLPDSNLWVSDYPYLQREGFVEVSRRLQARSERESVERSPRRSRQNRNSTEPTPRRPRNQEYYAQSPDWEESQTERTRRRPRNQDDRNQDDRDQRFYQEENRPPSRRRSPRRRSNLD
jgi:hypothetical protein